MPLRQTIGISLALLMATTGAMAKAPEKSTAYHPATSPNAEPAKSAGRSGKSRSAQRAAHFRWPSRLAFHRGGRTRYRQASSDAAEADSAVPDPNWGPMHSTGYQEIGAAAWYDLVGSRTSSGERLDTDTPTAAHRSLPLGSCAKVTSLDTGRSVIVKINDRGPYSRGFIIDLSPRAAEELGMRHAGVAAVAVEPVAPGAAPGGAAGPTVAVYREPAATAAR
ncbi:MAG TPA: septal ring lytic transglycosylase RlpA family protein [Stellaceae bacterium]|jgi:rare lipoprotein A (peptidoglycan hydrolase)|nr:septal ring lytic transglycosylase RlpA family protein [Stellaceae bacterium]